MTTVIETPILVTSDRGGRGRGQSSDEFPPCIRSRDNQKFLEAVLGNPKRLHSVSRRDVQTVVHTSNYGGNSAAYPASTVSLGVQAIHQAFAEHYPVSLSPDFIWYMIIHEVAEHVRQNADMYARLFTQTPEAKQTIEVRDDSLSYTEESDWGRTISMFRAPLREKITAYTAELFLPVFSTTTTQDEIAMLVALMDASSPYYEYVVKTRCGIPQIRIEGEADDWAKLRARAEVLADEFTGLAGYFADLLPVLQIIADTASGTSPDADFWRSIYKYKGEHTSGGPMVSGWITAFFAHTQTEDGAKPRTEFGWESMHLNEYGGFETNQFPAHVTRVPFTWDYFGTKIPMAFAAGVTGVDYVDETFLRPGLGYAVVEV